MGVLGKIDIPVKHYQVNNHTLIDVQLQMIIIISEFKVI